MPKARKFIYAQRFNGTPKASDFTLVEEDLAEPKAGQIHVQALYLSVDPYMRSFGPSVGKVMIGSQVGKIVESRAKDFPTDSHVLGYFGWRTDTVTNPKKLTEGAFMKPYLLEAHKGLPLSLALGVLGMPGNTAYFGMSEVCSPQPGETVVVSAAAGAVGSVAGQIAKIRGCKVIGLTGSDAKVRWLKELGFDHALNYKTAGNLRAAIQTAAPDGVDCYFDNVGGVISDNVIRCMNAGGRVAGCGSISTYNRKSGSVHRRRSRSKTEGKKDVKVSNFSVFSWEARWQEGIDANLVWVREGKLRWKESVTKGFEKMPQAFIGLFKGENIGKAVVKV